MAIDRGSLHRSLSDPAVGSMERVKDIASRFPDAISFGLGAPNPTQLDDVDFRRHIDRYLRHLCRQRGLTEAQAQRLLFEYGPPRGLINDLVAAGLNRDEAIRAQEGSIVITVGAQEALLLVLRAVCRDPGDLVGVVDPSYYGVLGAARLLDLELVGVREGDRGIDLDDLQRCCRLARRRGTRLRVLYVVPDFANPSGSLTGIETRRELLRIAEREDVLLLEDSTYAFTSDPAARLPSLKALDEQARVIHVGTFAKIGLPGARVGYVVADQQVGEATDHRLLADEIATLKSVTTVNTPPLCQALIGGMLLANDGSPARLGEARAPGYRRNLTVLLDALDAHLGRTPGVTWSKPRGGFFVQLRLPVVADEELLEISAERYGVIWTPLGSTYQGTAGAYQLRLACSGLEPAAIEDGVARLARLLRDFVPPASPHDDMPSYAAE